jgi:SpoVK/Ycf46/Vps4 family AAA+-type ATPase
MNTNDANAACLKYELDWFNQVLETRISLYFGNDCPYGSIYDVAAPELAADSSFYEKVVNKFDMNIDERLVMLLALIPHIRPQALDTFFIRNKNFDRTFTEFGGWRGNTHGGFLPTGETAAFLLAGDDLKKRFEILRIFDPDHFFARNSILRLEGQGPNEPFFSGSLNIATEYLNKFTSGIFHKPDYSVSFPAKLITTQLTWDDLVLPPQVFEELEIITGWMHHARTLMHDWGLGKVVKPGYRSLFYGPSGTGKTLTACLIGNSVGVDVYRIDLSMVVSKYIGETEKNLANIFDQAQNKNWILFFDEADALFGKRTQTSNANDRYANQEISYLLQRVEDFPGVVILATNLKANIDDAFARRFQSQVYFPMPEADQRLRLWENTLNSRFRPGSGASLKDIAEKYEISGGAITNVVRYGAIRALQNSENAISADDLVKGIARELRKEGKTIQELL